MVKKAVVDVQIERIAHQIEHIARLEKQVEAMRESAYKQNEALTAEQQKVKDLRRELERTNWMLDTLMYFVGPPPGGRMMRRGF